MAYIFCHKAKSYARNIGALHHIYKSDFMAGLKILIEIIIPGTGGCGLAFETV